MTKTPTSRRRRVRFTNKAEISIDIDISIKDVRHEEDSLETRSLFISAESSEETSSASELSSLGVIENAGKCHEGCEKNRIVVQVQIAAS